MFLSLWSKWSSSWCMTGGPCRARAFALRLWYLSVPMSRDGECAACVLVGRRRMADGVTGISDAR